MLFKTNMIMIRSGLIAVGIHGSFGPFSLRLQAQMAC